MELEKLYELLETLPEKKFDKIEAQFCTALYYEIPAEKRPLCVTAFLTIADWSATSLRSGVWTFYEATPVRELEKTAAFLEKTDEGELFTIFSLGIHDYQNPKYAENYDYPQEWMEEAEEIDSWVMEHETWLNGWKQKILLDYKEEITRIFMKF